MSSGRIVLVALLTIAVNCSAFVARGATLTTLYSFTDGADGGVPLTGLTYHDGIVYGTTVEGGISNGGTIFTVDPSTGAESVVYDFPLATGQQDPNQLRYHGGAFYGTTRQAGPTSSGTVFKFNPKSRAATVLHTFGVDSDGSQPQSGLVFRGTLYGTTTGGGDSRDGTIFKVDPKTGGEAVLYNFKGERSDGAGPGQLIDKDGIFYGVTGDSSGVLECGGIYRFDPTTGIMSVLYTVTCEADGALPTSLAYEGGNLYVPTNNGSTFNAVCSGGCGAILKINAATGAETVIYSFNGADGGNPFGPLTKQGGFLYGTTIIGGGTGCGGAGCGTIFKLNPVNGKVQMVYSFTGGADGKFPKSGVISQGGALYGTTSLGGVNLYGTVFKLIP